MKFFVALISFLLCCSHIMAECPSVCPALYSPVCGQAQINGKTVQCQFSNSCAMGVSACKRQINWRETGCTVQSPNCGSYY